MTISDGTKVQLHYTGKLTDGSVFDSSREREAFEFTLGAGQVIKGFDEGVRDMTVGSTKTVHIPAAEAYGAYLDELLREFPIENLNGAQVQAGQTVFMESGEGQKFPCQIKEVTAESFFVDFNHPLAGKDLIFDLELVKIL